MICYQGRGRNRPPKDNYIIDIKEKLNRKDIKAEWRNIESVFQSIERLERIENKNNYKQLNASLADPFFYAALLSRTDLLISKIEKIRENNFSSNIYWRKKLRDLKKDRDDLYSVYESVWSLRVDEDM